MKKSPLFSTILFILLGASLLSACGLQAQAIEPVTALVKADGAADTTQPTSVASPDAAPIDSVEVTASSEEAAPARLEYPVKNDKMELQILSIKKPSSVDLSTDPISGAEMLFKPGAGNMFLDFGIKVVNKTGTDIDVKWSDIYLVNKFQDKFQPSWGVYKESDVAIDPLLMKINKYDRVDPDFDPNAHFYMGNGGYIRVIFLLPRNNLYYYFGFGELPVIEIKNKYY
jgi:hypothetical protein